jgi:hypothetical protein
MPHSDDFDFDDDETAFLAVATQVEASQNVGFEPSPRPVKRRRTGSQELDRSDTDDEARSLPKQPQGTTAQEAAALDEDVGLDPEYYFPGEIEGLENQPAKKSKYKIHVPKDGGQFNASRS